jgi:hypothetical protein
LPEAAWLLASCAADPPPQRSFAYRFQEVEIRFVGRRVRRLHRLYKTAEPEIDSPAWREWLALDPQRAIVEAIRRSGPRGRILRCAQPPRMTARLAAPTLSTVTAG